MFRFLEDHSFSDYYGLNIEELQVLLTNLGYVSEHENPINYYNDYKNYILSIWSVMNCLNYSCKLDNYWKDSGTPSALLEVLRMEKIRLLVTKLLTNVSNSVEIKYLRKIYFNCLGDLILILQGLDPKI